MEHDLSNGYVYRITNTVNGKTYVGRHVPRPNEPWNRYLGSGRAIIAAVYKYGRTAFTKELVAVASSKAELEELENKAINDEVIAGKGEYNILISPTEKLNRASVKVLENADVLKLYFDELLSTAEIAHKFGLSQPTVLAYLRSLRDTDSRFEQIKQGTGLRKREPLVLSDAQKEAISVRMQSLPNVECDKSGDTFKAGGSLAMHTKSCNGVKLPLSHCQICGKELKKRTSLRCYEHKYFKEPS